MFTVCLSVALFAGTPLIRATPKDCLKMTAYQVALKHHLDPFLFLAIVSHESAWKVNAYNKKTRDYGLTQINISNIRKLGLDKRRLLSDPVYNLEAGAALLEEFQKRYAKREPTMWFSRFNCGTHRGPASGRSTCTLYALKINKRLNANVARSY